MAVKSPFKMAFGDLFPFGAGVVGDVRPDFEFQRAAAEGSQEKVQSRDKETGLPMWVVDVMDFDPEAFVRTHKVKIPASVQPVPPKAVDGMPVRPVVLEGLAVIPWVDDRGSKPKLGISLRATGLAEPRRSEHKAG